MNQDLRNEPGLADKQARVVIGTMSLNSMSSMEQQS